MFCRSPSSQFSQIYTFYGVCFRVGTNLPPRRIYTVYWVYLSAFSRSAYSLYWVCFTTVKSAGRLWACSLYRVYLEAISRALFRQICTFYGVCFKVVLHSHITPHLAKHAPDIEYILQEAGHPYIPHILSMSLRLKYDFHISICPFCGVYSGSGTGRPPKKTNMPII